MGSRIGASLPSAPHVTPFLPSYDLRAMPEHARVRAL